MSKDTLKNKARFSSTLEFNTKEKLQEYSKKSGVPVSIIIERALNEYIDKMKLLYG